MPARPVVPNVLKVEFLWDLDGMPAANVKYVLYSGTPPVAGTCAAIAGDLANAWWGPLTGLYPNTVELSACRVTDLSSDTGAEGTNTVAFIGTDTEPVMPIGTCVLVNHTIGRRYRGGHPRSYYPPPASEHFVPPNSWDSTTVSTFGTAEAAYALEASTFSESGCDGVYNVNVSYRSGDAPRVDPVVDQITGSVVSGLVRTQRRRYTASSY